MNRNTFVSILSREPDGMGYYYGFIPGDRRQINIRKEPQAKSTDFDWFAYVGGERLPKAFVNDEHAEAGAIKWAKENPDV